MNTTELLIVCAAVIIPVAVVSQILKGALFHRTLYGRTQTMKCSECGHEFEASFLRLYFTSFILTGGGINDENKRVMKCPCCKKKALCIMKNHQ